MSYHFQRLVLNTALPSSVVIVRLYIGFINGHPALWVVICGSDSEQIARLDTVY